MAETKAIQKIRRSNTKDENSIKLLQMLGAIGVGESVEIQKEEWNGGKSGPGPLVWGRFHKGPNNSMHFNVSHKSDATGWIIMRVS